MDTHIFGFEKVRDNFVLWINEDRATIRQLLEVKPVGLACKPEIDAIMRQPFMLKPFANSRLDHQVGCSLFKHASSHALLHVLTAASFHDYRFHTLYVKQMRQ